MLPRPVLAGTSILFADDNADSRLLFQTILKRAGALVDTVASGQEVIDVLACKITERSSYSAIVVELNMPGSDGTPSVAEVRKMGYAGPLVVLTADLFGAKERSAQELPVDLWLYKPIDRDQLIESLWSIIFV